jgi:hypothetical protein
MYITSIKMCKTVPREGAGGILAGTLSAGGVQHLCVNAFHLRGNKKINLMCSFVC